MRLEWLIIFLTVIELKTFCEHTKKLNKMFKELHALRILGFIESGKYLQAVERREQVLAALHQPTASGERSPMDVDEQTSRQWCQVCQVAHQPLHLEGCDIEKAPIKPPGKLRARRSKKVALAQ
jgi:hypothetical protein